MPRYDTFAVPSEAKHIANWGVIVRLQLPWAKPGASELGFVTAAASLASQPHLLTEAYYTTGRALLKDTAKWQKWLSACADKGVEISAAQGAFARPEQVAYGQAVVANNQATQMLMEGNPRRAKAGFLRSLELQRRNAQQPWGAARPAAALERLVVLLNCAVVRAVLGDHAGSRSDVRPSPPGPPPGPPHPLLTASGCRAAVFSDLQSIPVSGRGCV